MYKIGVAALLSLSFSIGAYAASIPSELTLTAITNPTVGVAKEDSARVKYLLQNDSKKSYRLSMKPMVGVSQERGEEYCGDDKELEPGKTCVLSLLVSGYESKNIKNNAPELCDNSWTGAKDEQICVKAKADETINAYELPAGKASFTVRYKQGIRLSQKHSVDKGFRRCTRNSMVPGCNLILFYDTGIDGGYEITNTSTQYAITGFDLTGIPAGLSMLPFSDSCIQNGASIVLAPGYSCYIDLVAGTGVHYPAQQPMTIVTSTSGNAAVTVQVLGIGDAYEGGQLVKLPSTSDYTYLSADTSDAATGVTQNVAFSSCASPTRIPTIDDLISYVYPASTCSGLTQIGGPLTGITCGDDYWSDTTDIAVNFLTNMETLPANGNARCLIDWVLSEV